MRYHLLLAALLAAVAACTTATDDHIADMHADHAHIHGDGCGHAMVWHVDHWDYLHDGHLHFVHDGHVDEHVIPVSAENPADEAPLDQALHADHVHEAGDPAHPMVPHGDHMDFLHDGRLHHVHGDHIDDHGPVTVQQSG